MVQLHVSPISHQAGTFYKKVTNNYILISALALWKIGLWPWTCKWAFSVERM